MNTKLVTQGYGPGGGVNFLLTLGFAVAVLALAPTQAHAGALVSSRSDPPVGVVTIDITSTNHDVSTTNSVYVGTAGDLKVDMDDGSTATFKSVPSGYRLEISIKRVYKTGTTASDIIAEY